MTDEQTLKDKMIHARYFDAEDEEIGAMYFQFVSFAHLEKIEKIAMLVNTRDYVKRTLTLQDDYQ
jgi:hypothetical protein